MTVDTLTREQTQTLDELLTPDVLSKLHRACRRKCFGTFEPEELASMTLLRVARSMDTWKGGNFTGWVMSVMYSVWKSELKRRSAHPETVSLPDSMSEGWDEDIALDYVLEDEVLHTELSPEVEAALSRLPQQYRDALILHAYGYSYIEISKATGVSTGTLGSRLRRARHVASLYLTR